MSLRQILGGVTEDQIIAALPAPGTRFFEPSAVAVALGMSGYAQIQAIEVTLVALSSKGRIMRMRGGQKRFQQLSQQAQFAMRSRFG